MQKLLFEEAWDRTISETDRSRIKEAFQETILSDTPTVQFSPLWQAINHKGELLVTVIIHNKSKESFCFTHRKLNYSVREITVSKHTFSLPFLMKGNTSTPWTFIFPKASTSISSEYKLKNGKLEIVKNYDPV